MKRFLILCALVLTQIACNADESALHVRYRNKTDLSPMLEVLKKTCEEVLKREFKIVGDTNLMGVSMTDEYWSTNGLHAMYKMTYTYDNSNVTDSCTRFIAPKINVTYEDVSTKHQYRYQRNYQNWGESNADPWAALEALQREGPAGDMQGDVGSEYWSVKKLSEGISSEMKAAMASVGWKPLVSGGKVAGKDKVAGRTCTVYQPEVFNNDDTVCMWKPNVAGLPNEIPLKGNLSLTPESGIVSVAEKVDLNAAVPSSVLMPPTEWQGKAVGSYQKSKKTNDEWMGSKQLRALKKAQRNERKNLPSEGDK